MSSYEQKCVENQAKSGGQNEWSKTAKKGKKMASKIRKLFFSLLHHKMTIILFFSTKIVANETIAGKILVGGEKSYPLNEKIANFRSLFFSTEKIF